MTEVAEATAARGAQRGPPESDPVPLVGGITNRNYRLRWGGRECVLRLPGKHTALLGIDRVAERDATRAAAVAPEVLAFDERLGCLVTAFIPGRPVNAAELRGPLLEEAAGAPRALHAGPALEHGFSPWERIDAYRATAL